MAREREEGGAPVKGSWFKPARFLLWTAVVVWAGVIGVTVVNRLSTPPPQIVPIQTGTNDLGTSVSIVPFNTLPGMPLRGVPAPSFALRTAAGSAPVTLRALQGRIVVLAFVNPVGTSLEARAEQAVLAQVKRKAGTRVWVVVIDANPQEEWASWPPGSGLYLSGSLKTLRKVWQAYHISVLREGSTVVHTPAVYLIGARGDEQRLFMLTGTTPKRVSEEVAAIWTDIQAAEKPR